jgi:hypothetical protein
VLSSDGHQQQATSTIVVRVSNLLTSIIHDRVLSRCWMWILVLIRHFSPTFVSFLILPTRILWMLYVLIILCINDFKLYISNIIC